MGRAKYISGGEEGRYTIELDFGSEEKQANLDRLNARVAQLEVTIAAQQNEYTQAQAIVAQIRARVDQIVTDYIEAWKAAQPEDPLNPGAYLPTSEPLPPSDALTRHLDILRKAESTVGIMKANLDQWRAEQDECRRQITRWNEFQSVEQRDAWCVDYTEEPDFPELPLRTIEIEGEPQLILVGPGAVEAADEDGYVAGREVQRGYQVYWNAAVLPGWQKWRPTYRTGVITALYPEINRCDVALDQASSTAQGLGINQTSTLEFVEIRYMDCDSAAFEEDDHVVVEFQLQDWSLPRVIGFVDTPRPCGLFKLTGFAANSYLSEDPGETEVTLFTVIARVRDDKASELIGDIANVSVRINGVLQPYDFSLTLQTAIWRQFSVPNSPWVGLGRVAGAGSEQWTCDDYLFAVNAPAASGVSVQIEYEDKLLLDAVLSMPTHGYVDRFFARCLEPVARAPVTCTIRGFGFVKPSGVPMEWIALNPPPEVP